LGKNSALSWPKPAGCRRYEWELQMEDYKWQMSRSPRAAIMISPWSEAAEGHVLHGEDLGDPVEGGAAVGGFHSSFAMGLSQTVRGKRSARRSSQYRLGRGRCCPTWRCAVGTRSSSGAIAASADDHDACLGFTQAGPFSDHGLRARISGP